MTVYSDEEVKEAIAYTKGSETLPVIAELVWAASQYLKAKPVINFYGEKKHYEAEHSCVCHLIDEDQGQRAREFLNNN